MFWIFRTRIETCVDFENSRSPRLHYTSVPIEIRPLVHWLIMPMYFQIFFANMFYEITSSILYKTVFCF